MVRGAALMLLRQYRRCTQNRLAELSGISKATISAYERGLQEIGEANRRRMLRALGLPSRAWEATVRHVEWLEWLAARNDLLEEGALPEDVGEEDLAVLRREVGRVAEAAGRDRERQVGTLLEIFAHLLS
jgi:transcriptional regulator with XRE-family HTH domain